MKCGLFNTVRGGIPRFKPYADKYGNEIELVAFDCTPELENLDKLKDCEAFLYTPYKPVTEEFWKKLSELGIKYIVSSTAGYDHLNVEYLRKYHIKAANVPFYSPNAISEHTVMLALALLRKFREQIIKVEKNNYLMTGLCGREMRNQTVGIVGAGRIGYTTMKCLSGFSPKRIYACDPYENDRVKEYAEYISQEELYEKCDIIIYHCVYNEENHHMVNKQTIGKMKDGVILINTARGGIFDTEAVLEGVKSGKIGGVGIDVIEGEDKLKKMGGGEHCPLPLLEELLSYNNVIFTSHTAFFTDEADRNLTQSTMDNLHQYITTGCCDSELVK